MFDPKRPATDYRGICVVRLGSWDVRMTKGEGATSGPVRPKLHEVKPRELTGRDVIERFQGQFRGAGLACLEILKGGPVDRVYCDYQEDYVAREAQDGIATYHFVQVKTKALAKHQWRRLELFGIPKRVPAVHKSSHAPGPLYPAPSAEELFRVSASFVGRLLEHTVSFGEACGSVTFSTNVHLDDEVEEIAAAIAAGELSEKTFRFIADNFVAIFNLSAPLPMADIHSNIRKLRFVTGQVHLAPHDEGFGEKAVHAIWRYSEVNLNVTEGVELVKKLLALVQRKSTRKPLGALTEQDLNAVAGIGIDDLLDLLPVSRAAYYNFLSGGDEHALKSASILQRKLSEAGARPEIIETASRWKISWDSWFRTHRHTYEQEITFLQHELNGIYGRWARGDVPFAKLPDEIMSLKQKLSKGLLECGLTDEILTGGVMAELVRGESR